MKFFKHLNNYFTRLEKIIWFLSFFIIIITFLIFNGNKISLIASLIGITSLILLAKGNPIGQFLMVLFSIMYGYISYSFSYYGEMLTYLGMTMPMAIVALISWIKHPYKGKKHEVEIYSLNKNDYFKLCFFTIFITWGFYYILKYLNTSNLPLSTISIATSFIAVYLTYKRSPYYALGYAANDVVLIALWIYASIENKSYIPIVICFILFLFNDLYGFSNWRKMKIKQDLNL